METAGESFARAIAAKDAAALRAVLSDVVDFQALTPGRHFQAATGTEAAVEIILGRWFAPARIDQLCSVAVGEVAGRGHVAYRLRVRAWDGDYLVEQQAYYDTDGDGRIGWMRLLCSGYRPVFELAR
jgi:hypothetical protein